MELVDLARWQFGITTVYHFLFVPITIGLSALVAGFQTAWYRTGNERWLRLTRFFGKLFLINFAIGVVTGIVQEFQFGMNWSEYSRFVGDIFGAPLAIEGLAAFFLESTFLGLWIFGWGRLPRLLHLASIWMVHIGTLLSSYFILAANSWMQHPVGYEYNPETGRAELTDFWAVMVNKVQLVTFPHVVLAAYMTGAAFVLGIAFWLLIRKTTPDGDRPMYRSAARVGAVAVIISGIGVVISGDFQGKVMTDVQPMKMAAAEALYESSDSCAPFSVFTLGSLDGKEERFSVTVPCVLSFLATGSFDGKVVGINELREQYQEQYGTDPGEAYYTVGDYTPVIPIAYWSFRLMMGFGMVATVAAAWLLWLMRGSRIPNPRWAWLAISLPFLPLAANSFGWIFTEMGRQPWVVFGLMTTETGVSPSVSVAEVATSLITFTLLYGVLAVIEVGLLLRWIKRGADPYSEPPDPKLGEPVTERLTFAY